MNLSEVRVGTKVKIKSFATNEIVLKLMEMGCLPGEEVTLERIAPLGDPIAIAIEGYLLSLRKSEASTVLVVKK